MENVSFLKRKYEENKFIWGSFVLAAFVMLGAYILLGYFPFGDNVILKVDMYHQYGPFHEELRNRLVEGKSLLYSWEGGLGKDFISQFAYYTASPLSFLMLLFPQDNMPEAMALFILLKVAFSASFFAFYLKKRFGRNDITLVLFSLMYASMAFITSYYWNVMWLDAVALFPLVALGIEELIKEKKYKMYCISLAIVILVNFYIAFLVCIFASIYFFVVLFTTYSWANDRKTIINRFIHFAILSAIAGGISMVLTIPTAIALSHTQASDANFPTMKIYENVYQLITNHFVGARPVVLGRNEDLPNLYSGLFTMIVMPFYYLNKNIKLKEKVLNSLFLIFILLCSCINTLDFIVHGFHFPSNLPHRFTFIYSFVIIAMAYKAFLNLRAVKLKRVYIFYGFYVAIIALTEFVIAPLNKEVERVLTDYDLLINVVVGTSYILFILQIFKGNKNKFSPIIAIIILIFVECIFSTTTGIAYTGRTYRDKYVRYIPGVNKTIEYLKEKDGKDFTRMEMRRFITINEASLYHFKGFSQFSSLAYGNTSLLMEDIGVAATGNSYRLYDPTPLVDSMFNLKYIINRDKPLKETFYKHVQDIPIEEGKTDDKNFIYIYENPYVLPLGFMVNNEVLDWNTAQDNPFDVQNDFIKVTTGSDDKILDAIPITELRYENLEITNSEKDSEKSAYYDTKNINKYKITKPQDLDAKPKMIVKIKVPKEQRIFLYTDAGNAKRAVYKVIDKKGKQLDSQDRELSTGRSTLDVGVVPKGAQIILELELTRKGEYEKTYRKTGTVEVYAASFNTPNFEKAQKVLAKNPMVISDYGDSYINGTVKAEKDGFLYTSIPYDKGWTVKVDGNEVETIAFASEGLLGIKVPKGEHTIEFSYYTVGLNLGIIVTIFSLAAFVIYIRIMEKNKNNKTIEIKENESN